ncbi:protein of unknown function [Georgfuchsia toluolica]|uniref:Uncharacterized protein n=1 Tax=Georgfuchsia toluolica TaxID=424218 RepID=A0A916N335_9PROT|nr:protein of unknown function [Georgfuchsia toluolica]
MVMKMRERQIEAPHPIPPRGGVTDLLAALDSHNARRFYFFTLEPNFALLKAGQTWRLPRLFFSPTLHLPQASCDPCSKQLCRSW